MKVKKVVTIVITVLAVLMVIFSGVLKLAQSAQVTETLAKTNMLAYTVFLGMAEILFMALFLYKPTLKIGFILLTAYFAGALAVEISYGMSLNALTPMILIWIAAFLRDRGIFLPQPVAR